ncbi:Transposon Ty3-G Gag-Pol polyprotein [Labeo rohita]|uniref:Gypsy retrotransposon integrase-like protein 1 n=1 Tax=Labeo rohita TaxID=84645 RepID=A0ABQ8MWW1_LABRO|nr:Transposon Ty3-G Gag-Pol polyprotein [Labeo rohita]
MPAFTFPTKTHSLAHSLARALNGGSRTNVFQYPLQNRSASSLNTVEAIAKLSKADLMEEDGCTPSVRRIKSVLGMILYYQHFIPNCSSIPAGEEKARPIAFASKSLSNSQRGYPAHKLEFLALKWSRWVSKLAAYSFDLKHIAGSKNTVADALSRDPFTKSVSHRLITERYGSLLTEAEGVDKDGVQDTFRLQVNSLHVLSQSSPVFCDHTTVRNLLNLHNQWETVTELRAMQTVQSFQNIATTGPDTISAIPLEDIRQGQESDPVISKIIPYLSQRKRPSRREVAGMDAGALVLLKQWDWLKVQGGVIYRVSKDPLSNHKRFQLVLPSSLRAKALAGVHDLAGHQGQSRTLQLTRQRFFWLRMERDIRKYVKCCQRCILAKTPEPSSPT